MSAEYLDTPATDRGDVSLAQVPALDFSIIQPFASPSKNPADDLRTKMRGLRAGQQQQYQQHPTRTPRLRNALVDRRNPAGTAKQEFTPLLRSAKRKELLRQSMLEEKENNILSGDIPETPAGFRSSYGGGDGTQLPLNSSMIDGESSMLHSNGMQMQHAVSSSMMSVTPVPTVRADGGAAVLDQGNVLSLRDQEAKLDQIQKDNFGLKLKIHFLEEALRKTGNEFHRDTLKENAELKTEKFTAEADLKRQKKRMLVLEQEMVELRQKNGEMSQDVRDSRGAGDAVNKRHAEQIAQLQSQADEAQRLADRRLEELEDLQHELRDSEQKQPSDDEVQALKEDIQDLERELRDRDAQLDSKAEEVESLQAEMRETKVGSQEAVHLQQDIDELEADLKSKEEQLDAKDQQILDLETQIKTFSDRDTSAKKLRSGVSELETKLRDSEQALDEANEEVRVVRKQLRHEEEEHAAEIEDREAELDGLQAKIEELEEARSDTKQNEAELKALQQDLNDRDSEIRGLEERLKTARGSWDAEAHQTDARLQGKDRAIKQRETQLREKSLLIEQRDDELDELKKRLRISERQVQEATQAETGKMTLLREQIRELEESARIKDHDLKERMREKDTIIEERSAELRNVQRRVETLKGSEATDSKARHGEIERLESANRNLVSVNNDQTRRITALESKLQSSETPSRKETLLREQRRQIETLQASLSKLEQDKREDLNGLESELDRLERDNLRLRGEADQVVKLRAQVDGIRLDKEEIQRKLDRANQRINEADGDQSMIGHQSDELSQSRAKILTLEDELDQLRSTLSRQQAQTRQDLERLQNDMNLKHNEARQSLEDELIVLEASLEEVDNDRQALSRQIASLESEVKIAREAKDKGTPMRESQTLRVGLAELQKEREQMNDTIKSAEHNAATLQNQIKQLQLDLDSAREEKTLASERADLHELVKKAKIDAESMQIKLTEREKKLSASSKRESELRAQLDVAQLDIDDMESKMKDMLVKVETHAKRETELRTQLIEAREARHQVEDLELQLGDRNSSSNGHARREAELRVQLRDAKIALEGMQVELAEKEDRVLTLLKREHVLRDSLKRARTSTDDTLQAHVDSLNAQLMEVDADVESLRQQIQERDKMLDQSQRKELEFRSRIKKLQRLDNDDDRHASKDNVVQERRHRQEMRGLATQIELLRARCAREESFRTDLIYTKQWFLMQVAMYNECNQADLRLLEDMGIAADQTLREKRPSLRSAGLAVLAAVRMQKMSAAWAVTRHAQKELVRKVDHMKKVPRRRKEVVSF